MARTSVDKSIRYAIRDAQNMVRALEKSDGNEAETRRRVERMFDTLMGYDVFKHITREHAVRGAGETEHCDFVIQVEEGPNPKPEIMVELKRVGIDLAPKHVGQAAGYAINKGCEWVLLTNSKDWRLYHVTFGQPPETKLVQTWNLFDEDFGKLASMFDTISYRNVRKGNLDQLWQKASVLTPRSVLSAILSEDSVKLLRKRLKSSAGVPVSPEDVVKAVRRMLNEASGAEMENIRISIPEGRNRIRKDKPVYDRSFYVVEHGEAATAEFLSAVDAVKAIVTKNGWDLQQKNTMYYVGFKAGKLRPFAVHWSGKTGWDIEVKVPESVAREHRAPNWKLQRYEDVWKQALMKPASPSASMSELEPLLAHAYKESK
jgi:hypothetical protein